MLQTAVMCRMLALLCALLCLSTHAAQAWDRFDRPLPSEMLMPVNLGRSGGREKRQAIAKTQPLRVLPVYAANVDANLQAKATLVRNTIIPKLLDFVQQSLSVAPLPGPILLNNRCTTNAILHDSDTGEIKCGEQCAPTTCGLFQVPQEHLKQCIQCNTNTPTIILSNCVPGSPAQDGAGVLDYDFILYITADQTACPAATAEAQTVAFARSCQTEATQDRPVAGTINFCPDGVQNRDPAFAFAVSKHEVLHALGFSSFLFALWRDPATNTPRTPRGSDGLPSVQDGTFVIAESTVESATYATWRTATSTVSHQVMRLVTPAVRAEARRHFDCPTLAGVELENQGGPGTAMEHWEKRVLGNEAMTGQVTFNPVFSRLTFAALEDSGWYQVNYSLADELVWGRGAGCRFVEGSCREWIDRAGQSSPAPFCELLESTTPLSLSCTADHEAVSRCNRISGLSIPAEFQYFSDSGSGGRIPLTDFCPVQDVFSFSSIGETSRTTTCFFAANVPPSNLLLEAYGPSSRCVTHGRQWTANGLAVSVYGGGCYQYSCGEDQVDITIAEQVFVCNCSAAGNEMMVDLMVESVRYQGSIVCPPCTSICHVPSRNIVQDIAADTVTLPRSTLPPTMVAGTSGRPTGRGGSEPSTASASCGNLFLVATVLGLTAFLH